MNDISDLMLRDPLKLTEEDIDKIIAAERNRRHLYRANPAATTKAAPKLTAKQEATKKALNLDIDLGL